MDRSYSLTPPISPIMQKRQSLIMSVLDDVPYFSCKERSNSYLKSKHFSMFLNIKLNWNSECIITISGKRYSTHSAFWNNLPQLFANIKKYYSLVKALTMDKIDYMRTGDIITVIQTLRKNICSLFTFLLKCLQTFYYEHSISEISTSTELSKKSELLSKLTSEIKTLLQLVGRISNISYIKQVKDFNDNSKSAEYYYHYFHTCLDIWWNSIALLQMVSIIPINFESPAFCCDIEQFESFSQVVMLVISDLINLATTHHESFNSVNHSPFICKCVEEFWIMLRITLDKKFGLKENSFWSVYYQITQEFCKQINKDAPPELSIHAFSLLTIWTQSNNISELCLWLTSHVAPLYKYDEWGDDTKLAVYKNGYTVVKNLVNLLIASKDTKERNLRTSLFYCTQIVMIWEPSCDIIMPLTDFYIKKINETFLPGSEINSLNFMHSNSSLWFQQIVNLSSLNTALSKESSYDLYLKILYMTLSKAAKLNLWRSLKGRIYSKFMSKKIKEFSEIAIQNSFTLFLVIINAGDEELKKEITDKICEFASVIETVSNPRKQMISWKALFVLMHIYQTKKWQLDAIIIKLASYFNGACTNYNKIKKDSTHKSSIMNLLLVYIDSTSEIFEQGQDLNLSEYKLLDVQFSTLLSSCHFSELNYILNSLLNIFKKVQRTVTNSFNFDSSIKLQYVPFLKHMLAHIYPCIKTLSVSNTPSLCISDIAVLLINLVYNFSTLLDPSEHEFSNLFLNFTSQDNVSSLVICRFLSFILDDASLIKGLNSKLDFDIILFQLWLKCMLYLTPPCDQMKELTPKVLKHSKILDIFPGGKNLDLEKGDHVYISIALFQCMGKHFENCTNFQEKSSLKIKMQQYFKPFVNCVNNRIEKNCDVSTLSHVYKLISHIVEYCSSLLHTKFNSDSILPKLLDKTIYPHLIFPKDKNLQSIIFRSISDYLKSFLRGLLKLNYVDDKCIRREIKSIIVTFIGHYSLSHNPIAQMCIECTVQNPELVNFLLEIIEENLLNNAGDRIGFHICFEMLKVATTVKQLKDISKVLLMSALKVYMRHSNSFTDFLYNLVRDVCTHFRDKIGVENSMDILVPTLKCFIEKELKWSTKNGFTILNNIIDCYPDLFPEILPFLSKTVTELEKMRGIGKDFILRDHLQNIVKNYEMKRLTKEKK